MLVVHNGNATGQIGLAHRTITNDYGFIERIVDSGQHNFRLSATYFYFFTLMAYIRKKEYIATTGFNGISSIIISQCAAICTLYGYENSCEFLTGIVTDGSSYF